MQNFRRLLCEPAKFSRTAIVALRLQQRLNDTKLLLRQKSYSANKKGEIEWPRKIFSGIQPTGALHLGNYLGAIKQWKELQNTREDVTICVVDLHSLTMPQEPAKLRENIFEMTATLLACGIEPSKCTIFVQSEVKEHAELSWILTCMTNMARLSHLPQFKEKTKKSIEIPCGIFMYPVLQAADILLYKATHVPVGEDQKQHIQLAQQLAKNFNTKYGETFPICHTLIDKNGAARIRSLRDPGKKMSKSDPDLKAALNLTDTSDKIVEKIKKAVTDFQSEVTYNPEERPGVSNLLTLHSLLTGDSIDKIVKDIKGLDTGNYKLYLGDVLVEKINPIRSKIKMYMSRRMELIHILESGADKARETAEQTISEVKDLIGIGTSYLPIVGKDSEKPPLAPAPAEFETIEKKFSPKISTPAKIVLPKSEKRMLRSRKPFKFNIDLPARPKFIKSNTKKKEENDTNEDVNNPTKVVTALMAADKKRRMTK